MKVASRSGLTAVFGGILPVINIELSQLERYILFQRLPYEWARRYKSNGYYNFDPIIQRLKVDKNPFSWRDGYNSCSCHEHVKRIHGEASEFGLREGYVIPVSLLDGDLSAVSFGGAHIDISDEDRAMLSFATNYAIGRLLQLKSCRGTPSTDLTPREFDCLAWAAEGKTDWEISVILGISKSTVVKHVAAARDKLGAVNKAHAIATALRGKLIQ